MTVIREAAKAESVAGEVDSGDALSKTRSYVVTAVPTRPRGTRASKRVVGVSCAIAIVAKMRL